MSASAIGNTYTVTGFRHTPGEIDTAILSPGTEQIVEHLPLRRLGRTEEVAKAIYYLCTDQSSYVTGPNYILMVGSMFEVS